MPESDPEIVESPLSRTVSRDGITVRVHIFRLESERLWGLEVINDCGTSIVWDQMFNSDTAAFEAFARAVVTEGMATFLDDEDDVPAGATLH